MCSPANDVLGRLGEEFHGPGAFVWSAFRRAAGPGSRRWGFFTAWWFFLKKPALADSAAPFIQMAVHDIGR